MIGKKLSHYTVLDRLGAGGMGEVYLARDEHLGRDVALKILPEEFTGDPKRVARFHRDGESEPRGHGSTCPRLPGSDPGR